MENGHKESYRKEELSISVSINEIYKILYKWKPEFAKYTTTEKFILNNFCKISYKL